MIIKFSQQLVDIYPDLFSIVQSSYLSRLITYYLDSRFAKSTKLQPWIKEQVDADTPNVDELVPTGFSGYDSIAIEVLKKVREVVEYKIDSEVWGAEEYWATAEEVVQSGQDDCDGGAVLAYVMCRRAGIPADRLMIFAGDVNGGGHAWLGYRPDNYPLNWVFLDWCYWPTNSDIKNRPMFYIDGKKIKGYLMNQGVIIGDYDNYYSIWFGFNEENSYSKLSYSYHNRQV